MDELIFFRGLGTPPTSFGWLDFWGGSVGMWNRLTLFFRLRVADDVDGLLLGQLRCDDFCGKNKKVNKRIKTEG